MDRKWIRRTILICIIIGFIVGGIDFFKEMKIKKVVIYGNIIKEEFILENDNVYVDFHFLKTHLDREMRMNEKRTRAYFKSTYSFKNEEIQSLIDETGVELNVHTLNRDNKNYVPLLDVQRLIGIKVIQDRDKVYINQYDKNEEKGEREKEIGKGKITLAWEYVGDKNPNIENEDKIKGLQIVSPTWFNIVNTQGIIVNSGEYKYMKDAKEKGYGIWALVKNNFNPKLTRAILNDEKVQDKVIGQLILFSEMYDLDGINIDFENIFYEDQDKLTNFVKRLRYYTEKNGLVLSMDVTVPGGSKQWSLVYDRKELAKHLDYLMLMAYDEHWASSPDSGSVASIGWVDKGIKRSLEVIPKEKLVLGMPFYMRVWTEEKLDKKIKVSSKAITMGKLDNIVDSRELEPVWNEDVAQYYTEYVEDNKTYKIWIEDKKSIEEKVSLAKNYDLAGICAWRKGFEKDEIWGVFEDYLEGN
ncbi:MAG: glycosyl hydrolase family 18 protein [Anaeromicrobium sp.]|uniref:glycosyl hydrolase family 18 protein n=1 Tax=Anaeromicrobium sp. TaxID=1929132 RepID=UPI0025EF574E|nr:glycosyl hydrolase family 18 protein [Anaeromicrobium sp.]MCT4595506.1 glycosyl hydrolase family 18 protein [Anaeromicrobium sp.]